MDAVKTIIINLMRTFSFQNSRYKKVEDIQFDWKFTLKVANGYGLIINENIREWNMMKWIKLIKSSLSKFKYNKWKIWNMEESNRYISKPGVLS